MSVFSECSEESGEWKFSGASAQMSSCHIQYLRIPQPGPDVGITDLPVESLAIFEIQH